MIEYNTNDQIPAGHKSANQAVYIPREYKKLQTNGRHKTLSLPNDLNRLWDYLFLNTDQRCSYPIFFKVRQNNSTKTIKKHRAVWSRRMVASPSAVAGAEAIPKSCGKPLAREYPCPPQASRQISIPQLVRVVVIAFTPAARA